MGQILHGSARATETVRRAIQHSQESLRSLSARYGLNQKTVAKWKKRTSDAPAEPSRYPECADAGARSRPGMRSRMLRSLKPNSLRLSPRRQIRPSPKSIPHSSRREGRPAWRSGAFQPPQNRGSTEGRRRPESRFSSPFPRLSVHDLPTSGRRRSTSCRSPCGRVGGNGRPIGRDCRRRPRW